MAREQPVHGMRLRLPVGLDIPEALIGTLPARRDIWTSFARSKSSGRPRNEEALEILQASSPDCRWPLAL